MTDKGILSMLNQMVTDGVMDEEDEYQIVVKVDDNITIEDMQANWSLGE